MLEEGTSSAPKNNPDRRETEDTSAQPTEKERDPLADSAIGAPCEGDISLRKLPSR